MELRFVDLTGPVTIPAESAETVIKVGTGDAPPRPASKVEIAETLDTRQFNINGALPLEIKATASGLVPDLDQLLDLAALKKAVGVKAINPHEGLQVKEINTWGDQVAPRSERLWTISLNGDPIRAAEGMTEFQFPQPKAKDSTVVYQTYDDMNLATLPQPSTKIGRDVSGKGELAKPKSNVGLWLTICALALLAGIAIRFFAKRQPGAADGTVHARDVFKMPAVVDGFAVVALLRRLRTSPLVKLPEPQQQELQQDLQRVQQSCFGANGGAMSEADLRGVVEKWLRMAC
jgi:hypothetical protein